MSGFTVFLKVTGGDKLSLEVTPKQTIAELKTVVATKCDIPAENQRLIYKGQVLKDEKTVEDYGKQGFRDHTEQLHDPSVSIIAAAEMLTCYMVLQPWPLNTSFT